MSGNDWSTQLKKIEREFDGLPPEPSLASIKMQTAAEHRAQQRSAELGAAARLFLVLALGAGVFLWPYARECGQGLFVYIGVKAMVVAAGIWVATHTWRHRIPRMHVLALLITLGGLILVAGELLPRTGYAAVDPQNLPQWMCGG